MRRPNRIAFAFAALLVSVAAGGGKAHAFTHDTHVYGGGTGDSLDDETMNAPKNGFSITGSVGGGGSDSHDNDLFLHSSDPNFSSPVVPFGYGAMTEEPIPTRR